MIKIENLTIKYKTKVIINDISHTFNKGSIYGLIGPNGIGKTTLFKSILGFIPPNSGKIYIDNIQVNHHKRDPIVKNISFLLSTGLIKNLSGWDNALLFAKLYGIDLKSLEELFYEFDIYNSKDKKVKNYSLGMTQRLSLVIALLNIKRNIIILDEPYLGLDPNGIYILNQKLLSLKKLGYTIIVSNHQLHESQELFDEVIFLTSAGLITFKDIKNNNTYNLSEKYREIYNKDGQNYE